MSQVIKTNPHINTLQHPKLKRPIKTIQRSNTALSLHLDENFNAYDNDICKLPNATESMLLDTLKHRFERELIYTYIGPILIAINPFYPLPIYNPKYAKLYLDAIGLDMPPHVFAIAGSAHQQMQKRNGVQCIVINGECGSGKTETSKFLLNQLMQLNSLLLPQYSNTLEHIASAGFILEAFGNAITLENANSSRFGKYTLLSYNDTGVYSSARIDTFLLEQGRIISQKEGERNYHVFYYLVSGAPEEIKNKLCIDNSSTFRYLTHYVESISKNNFENFGLLRNKLSSLGFDHSIQVRIFSLLSAILHLGNVTFSEPNFNDSLNLENSKELKITANLLRVSDELLIMTLTNIQKNAGKNNETILLPSTLQQIEYTRDALAKSLYTSLFDWILFKINQILLNGVEISCERKSSLEAKGIGILDMFGFENTKTNSFAQFCINYANEHLHNYFISKALKHEQLEYLNNKIKWRQISIKDNINCINLMGNKYKGLMSLINEESNFIGASDQTLYNKFVYCHENSIYFKPSQVKQNSNSFIITHYAGQVQYIVSDFIRQNKSIMSHMIMQLLKTSKDSLVRELIGLSSMAEIRWKKIYIFIRAVCIFKEIAAKKRKEPFLHPHIGKSLFLNTDYPTTNSNIVVLTNSDIKSSNDLRTSYSPLDDELGEVSFLSNTTYEPLKRISIRRRSKGKAVQSSLSVKSKIPSFRKKKMVRFNSFTAEDIRSPPTVISQYDNSLQRLIEHIQIANPFFILCFKSNSLQLSKHFDTDLVNRQLHSSAIFEVVKLRKIGYSFRMPYTDFLDKYRPIIYRGKYKEKDDFKFLSEFLRSTLPRNSYQVGLNKIFIRHKESLQLDKKLNDYIHTRVIFLQKVVRVWLARKRNSAFKIDLINFQTLCRGYLVRVNIRKMSEAAIIIQRYWKFHQARLNPPEKVHKKLRHSTLQLRMNGITSQYPPRTEDVSRIRNIFEMKVNHMHSRSSTIYEQTQNSKTISDKFRDSRAITLPSNVYRQNYIKELESQTVRKSISRENDVHNFNLLSVKQQARHAIDSKTLCKPTKSNMETDLTSLRFSSVKTIANNYDVLQSNTLHRGIVRHKRAASADIEGQYIYNSNHRNLTKIITSSNSWAHSDTSTLVRTPLTPCQSIFAFSQRYNPNSTPHQQQQQQQYCPKNSISPQQMLSQMSKLFKPYTDINNIPSETTFKKKISLCPNKARMRREIFQDKLSIPLPTNYCVQRARKSRPKPVTRRDALRLPGVGIDRNRTPTSPSNQYSFFTKNSLDDENPHKIDACASFLPSFNWNYHSRAPLPLPQLTHSNAMVFNGSLKSPKCKIEISKVNSFTKSEVVVSKTHQEIRKRSLTATISQVKNKSSESSRLESPISRPSTPRNSTLRPYKLKLPKLIGDRSKIRAKMQFDNFSHGHKPKLTVAIQKFQCALCTKTIYAFHLHKIYKCCLCSLVYHVECMPYASTCPSTTGDITLVRNLSELNKLMSFLSEKVDTLEERLSSKGSIDNLYINVLRRLYDNLVANKSLKMQDLSEEAQIAITQKITIRDISNDFSFLVVPLVPDHKTQILLRNSFTNLLEDFICLKQNESDLNATLASQINKIHQKRKNIVKPLEYRGHTFIGRHFNLSLVCESCNKPMLLVEAVQYCVTCEYVCHKHCISQITAPCSSFGDENSSLNPSSDMNHDSSMAPVSQFGINLSKCQTIENTKIPIIMEKLLNFIETTGLLCVGIYRKSSAQTRILRLRDELSKDVENADLSSYDVFSVCSALKMFFNELPEPLLTFDLYENCLRVAKICDKDERLSAIHNILKKLPEQNYACFQRLIFHLAQVAKEEPHNKMTPLNIAIVFAPCLLKSVKELPVTELASTIQLQIAFLEVIIEEHTNKVKDTLDGLMELDRMKRKTVIKLKLLSKEDSISDSGIFESEPIQEPKENYDKNRNKLLTECENIEKEKFSLTAELSRLDFATTTNTSDDSSPFEISID